MYHWWIITWNTYGSWLPGDPRGFSSWRRREYVPKVKRFNDGENETYQPANYRMRHAYSRSIVDQMIRFDHDDQTAVLKAIVSELDEMPVEPTIVAVGREHVHLLAVFGESPIRQGVGRLKAAATRTLKKRHPDWKRVWARNCHMQSISRDDEYHNAFHYVDEHCEQNALVHVWNQS